MTACSLEVSYDQSSYRCDDGQGCPSGFSCVQAICTKAPAEGDDAGVPDGASAGDGQSLHSWSDDSEGDFGSGTTDHAVVQARGAIEPYAYFTGGVLAHASDTGMITSGPGATWADVQAFPSTGKAALVRKAEQWWAGGETPAGVGLSNENQLTIAYEGEIWLEAGTWTFLLELDDHGFVDIADGSSSFGRVVSADWNVPGQGNFVAAAAAWYPIRWVLSDDGGPAGFKLSFRGPGVSSATVVPRARLRVRVDQLAGLMLVGFDDKLLVGDLQSTLDANQPANADWLAGRPGDLGLLANDYFSVRWSGQLRIDVPGDYSFAYNSDDGQRLWIDGALLSDHWDESSHNQITSAVTLASGWHDVVIDASESNVNARALLRINSGPELAGAPLPVDRLRPVEPRGERYESAVNRSDVAIPDYNNTTHQPGTAQTAVALSAPAGALVTGIDVSFAFDHSYTGDLEMRLIAPNGTSVLLRNREGTSGAQNEYDFYNGALLLGAPVTGTWTMRFTDRQAADVGTIRDFQLTVHYAGGEAPVPKLATYESAIRDLGPVAAVDRVSWVERAPAGASVAVKLRSCAAADCAGEPWSAALPDATGSPPSVTPQRYLQYRVEMSSSGDASASLESIQIDYRTSP